MTATANTQSDASITCAALRDLTRPAFTNARPTPASGTIRIRTTQRIAETSEREGAGIILWRPDERGPQDPARQTPPPSQPARKPCASSMTAEAAEWRSQSPIRRPAAETRQASSQSVLGDRRLTQARARPGAKPSAAETLPNHEET